MKLSASERLFDIGNAILMILLIICTVYPFYYVFMASISDSNLLIQHTGLLLKPLGFNLTAFEKVIANPNILSGYGNTLLILILGTAVNLFLQRLGLMHCPESLLCVNS